MLARHWLPTASLFTGLPAFDAEFGVNLSYYTVWFEYFDCLKTKKIRCCFQRKRCLRRLPVEVDERLESRLKNRLNGDGLNGIQFHAEFFGFWKHTRKHR